MLVESSSSRLGFLSPVQNCPGGLPYGGKCHRWTRLSPPRTVINTCVAAIVPQPISLAVACWPLGQVITYQTDSVNAFDNVPIRIACRPSSPRIVSPPSARLIMLTRSLHFARVQVEGHFVDHTSNWIANYLSLTFYSSGIILKCDFYNSTLL